MPVTPAIYFEAADIISRSGDGVVLCRDSGPALARLLRIFQPDMPGRRSSRRCADGKDVPLASFKGKIILVVNLARNSSYNEQLPALTKLSEKYQDKGLVVIGVPSNDFGAAEPGTDAEIQKFYKTDNKVPFPVMASSRLLGEETIPFYEYLTKGKAAPPGGSVHWNYTKFVIDKSGKVIARLEPDVAPDSPEMLSTIEQILSGTYKPKPKEEQAGPPSDDAPI